MQIKIISFDSLYGTVQVSFLHDNCERCLYKSIEVPIINGSFICGDELDRHILQNAPIDRFERMMAVKDLAAPPLELAPPDTAMCQVGIVV